MPLLSLSQNLVRVNLTFLNDYVRIPFACFWRGFYKTHDVIIAALIMHSCLSCADDYRHGGYYTLIR